MNEDFSSTSFSDFEHPRGAVEPGCALAIWYNEVRDTPFEKLKHWDIARAIRQKINIPELVSSCLSRLKQNPIQGDTWMGEPADTLTYVPESYWENNPEQLREYLVYLNRAWSATEDEDLNWTASHVIARRKG